ncbi:uncharacterized protein [Choristoneura fumiferana]|uniref:uncharacterized protein n=1 Tax=Choristoneura fumiferana TaxID=7141 RepID=UPI003D159FF6
MPTMMFKPVKLRPKKSNWGWDLEPDELRDLKFQLANLKCKCYTCQRFKPLQGIQDTILVKTHRGIQSNRRKIFSDRFIQVTPSSVLSEVYVQRATSQPSTEQVCPKCTAVALHTLHTGVTRIVKDEGSETITMITCHKSIGSEVKIVEKSTSTISNLVSRAYKDLTSSESSVEAPPSSCRRTNRTRVTFSGICQEELLLPPYRPPLIKPNCTCLEKFIESIRPPIIGF